MNNDLAQAIGAAARKARLALDLTQEDTAERLGLSSEFYARIERGHALPSVPSLVRICAILGLTADALLGRKEPLAQRRAAKKLVPAGNPLDDPPDVRRLLRRMRNASPLTVRIVTSLAKELSKRQP